MADEPHWTNESPEALRDTIAINFLDDIGVYSDDFNLTLLGIVKLARKKGKRPAIVLYGDDEIAPRVAPIHPNIFYECWVVCGKPRDMFELEEYRDVPTDYD